MSELKIGGCRHGIATQSCVECRWENKMDRFEQKAREIVTLFISDHKLDEWIDGDPTKPSLVERITKALLEESKINWPSDDELRKNAKRICDNVSETVTQGACKERATYDFYRWLKERLAEKK